MLSSIAKHGLNLKPILCHPRPRKSKALLIFWHVIDVSSVLLLGHLVVCLPGTVGEGQVSSLQIAGGDIHELFTRFIYRVPVTISITSQH